MTRKLKAKVPFITRVEGEGALDLEIENGEIRTLHLQIFEPPRLFEKFLIGRHCTEVPDLCARVCGICPMAYQLTSILAFERLFGVGLPPGVMQLRQLMNYGEWLQSHALHIHFLAAPDFFGCKNLFEIAEQHEDFVKNGLVIQSAGNKIMALLGGRSVHPVGLCIGGFHRLPTSTAWQAALKAVEEALPAVDALLAWTAALKLPTFPQSFTSVSLGNETHYPMNKGDIVTSLGDCWPVEEYSQHFSEHQEAHSTAFYSTLHGNDYLVGPIARLNNNRACLPPSVKDALVKQGLHLPLDNMFSAIQARAVECLFALQQAHERLSQGMPRLGKNEAYKIHAGHCSYATEAPRGLIYHEYELDDQGRVLNCQIIPPTSQNQGRIEADLHHSLMAYGLDNSDSEITDFCERVIRNYDPCISCSTHFLKARIKRH